VRVPGTVPVPGTGRASTAMGQQPRAGPGPGRCVACRRL